MVLAVVLPLFAACTPEPARTIENMKSSVECGRNTSVRYMSFAVVARKEGYLNLSTMFEAMAKTETISAENQFKVLKRYEDGFVPQKNVVEVGTTLENLKTLLSAEGYEAYTVYPIYERVAAQEKVGLAQGLFVRAAAIAKRQIFFGKKAILALESDGSDRNVADSWSVCPECGCPYVTTRLQKSCTLCHTPSNLAILFR